jgi:NAD(P)-dependent dehydrogenase (short-subunit alcohol dehydrogenase family)
MTNDASDFFSLEGRVALVTGGSRGLGREMVFGFARSGADVIVASRNFENCKVVADEVENQFGRSALAYGVHVGHWNEIDGLVDAAYERFGHVDVLINNAGISPMYGSVVDVTEELFDKVIDVNLKSAFRLTSLIGTRMADDRGGSIINISSTGSVHPRPDILPYAAAKSGLNALTLGFAHAFGPRVRCNAIMAGTFFTDVSKNWDPKAFSERSSRFALQRGGNPNEIVGAALYFASDASTYTTGAILTIDGGQP